MSLHHTLEVEPPDLGINRVVAAPDQPFEEAQAAAQQRSQQFESALEQVQNILRPALIARHAIHWDTFKRSDPYAQPEPAACVYLEYPPEPQADDLRYQPSPGAGTAPGAPLEEQQKRVAYEQYVRDYTAWADAVKRIEAENQKRYAENVVVIEDWNRSCQKHREAREAYNTVIDQRKADYEALLPEPVEDYCRQVLCTSRLPDRFQRVFDLQYLPETRTLIVEHALPMPESLPRVRGVKFAKTRGEFVDVTLPATSFNRIYADVLHQIVLRTLYELFDADTAGALNVVIFNGWVEPQAANGTKARRYVMAAKVAKEAFAALNLWDTDSRTCFKALKGVAGSKLHALAPVVPAQTIHQ